MEQNWKKKIKVIGHLCQISLSVACILACTVYLTLKRHTLSYIFGQTAYPLVQTQVNGNESRAKNKLWLSHNVLLKIPLCVIPQKKAMYFFFFLYKLNSVSAAPTHSSCMVYCVWLLGWRADHIEPPQQCCCLTSAWRGAEIVLLPRGGWRRFGGDRVEGWGSQAGCKREGTEGKCASWVP